MTEQSVTLAVDNDVAVLTLNRAEKLNALDAALLEALERHLGAVERNKDVRVVILTGDGERAFSAGGDIEAWSGLEPLDMWRYWTRLGHRVFDRLARLQQPVIAVINGHAFGGGLELAGAADIRILERHATVGLLETSIGMIPGWSGTQRLVRRFGGQLVRRLVLTGERLDADAAHRAGVVDQVCETGQGLTAAMAMAATIAARGPVAAQLAKQMVNAAEGEDTGGALEATAGALASFTDDLREGVASFREKRAPRFANR